ncbi:nucleotidyltransferase [Streptacidiphilus pinicola]|uniref:Nucleotidyltransferase n=1 Tax=Streptacidiphilus pinicola TaxID=2219663 RepID=A0A2X0K329_9ACTN|nr:nucleotidyltransferase [Streptacidiphilus pinicola]RAG81979.1 nucleotidyltransferase [Streptacidiphilus pinicola]
MSDADRAALLRRAVAPPSDAETERLERAERMIRSAVRGHTAFAGLDLSVEAKGSYANNTNVRYDSDVDIKVQLNDRVVHAYHPKLSHWSWRLNNHYRGPWTATRLRQELGAALNTAFGAIDATRNVAFYIPEVAGSRPSADVVPCFAYRQYRDANASQWDEGSIVHTRDGGNIVNWPAQQLVNGRDKNKRTNRRYKFAVRALKYVENDLARRGVINELPSYFMECLIYNVPDAVLMGDSLDASFRGAIAHLRGEVHMIWGNWRGMLEPNEMKKVFQDGQKWKIRDARQLLDAAWHHLNYGS